MLIYERIKAEKKRLEEENKSILIRLEQAPQGFLQCKNDSGFYRWYHKTKNKEGKTEYVSIRKKDRDIARVLAAKTYDSQKYKDNEREIAALSAYLNKHPNNGGKAKMIIRHPAFAELLRTGELQKELAAWKTEAYEKNSLYEEQLTIRAANGEMVRSKSEAFILSALAAAEIPYRYECKLVLDRTTLFPDFTIRRPADGKLIIWEHFGLMSDPAYLKNALEKIRRYIANGFYPMDNLVTTFEQEKSALDFSRVMDIIDWIAGV